MVERICSQCQHGNPIDNRFCGRCGHTLDTPRLPEASSNTGSTALMRTMPQLPAEMRQLGTSLAIGLAALAAEAGMAWLRRRVERIGMIPAPTAPTTHTLVHAPRANQPIRTVQPVQPAQTPPLLPTGAETIMRQQVVEIWEEGSLKRQIIERAIWQRHRS